MKLKAVLEVNSLEEMAAVAGFAKSAGIPLVDLAVSDGNPQQRRPQKRKGNGYSKPIELRFTDKEPIFRKKQGKTSPNQKPYKEAKKQFNGKSFSRRELAEFLADKRKVEVNTTDTAVRKWIKQGVLAPAAAVQ